jgi:hypothetical protein
MFIGVVLVSEMKEETSSAIVHVETSLSHRASHHQATIRAQLILLVADACAVHWKRLEETALTEFVSPASGMVATLERVIGDRVMDERRSFILLVVGVVQVFCCLPWFAVRPLGCGLCVGRSRGHLG